MRDVFQGALPGEGGYQSRNDHNAIVRHAACSSTDVNSVVFIQRLRPLPRVLIASIAFGMALLVLGGCERVEYRSIPGDSIRSGWASPERPSLIASAPTA